MLTHRLRRWPNNNLTLVEYLVLMFRGQSWVCCMDYLHNSLRLLNAIIYSLRSRNLIPLRLDKAFSHCHLSYKCYTSWVIINPLNPHDALKHHFTSLKTYLIFPKLGVLEWKLPWNWFTNTWQFYLIFHPLQVIFIHYKSRIATATRGL